MSFNWQSLINELNVWSVLALTSCSYVCATVHHDFIMAKKTKKPIYIAALCVAVIAIVDNITYVLYGHPGTELIIKWLYTVIFIFIELAPFLFLSLLEDSFFHSNKGIVTGMIVMANIAAMLFNLFYPILFTITPTGEYITYNFFFIRPLLISLTYLIVFGVVFRSKYNITKSEEFLLNQIGLIFLVGFVFYDLNYSGELVSALLGMGLHFITQIFHTLDLKTDSVTGLPNRCVYQNNAIESAKDRKLVVVSIDLNDLKKINDTMTHDEGDKYLYANANTLNDALKPYGKLYRTGGDEFVFLGHDYNKIKETLDNLQKVKNVNPQYGTFRLSFAYGITHKKYSEDVFSAFNRADRKMYENKVYIKSLRA